MVAERRGARKALIPTPADVVEDGSTRRRLSWTFDNADETLWDLDAGRHSVRGPLGNGHHANRWESSGFMARYLADAEVTEDDQRVPPEQPVVEETRVQVQPGVAGMLARHQVSRFVNRRVGATYCWGALVQLEDEAPDLPVLVNFGGEGRQAQVEFVDVPTDLLPDEPTSFPNGVIKLLTVTPSAFPRHGWSPPLPQNAEMVGAAVLGPMTVRSGTPGRWRLVRAAAPGSVYVVRFQGEPDVAEARAGEFAAAITEEGRLRGRCLKQEVSDMRSAGFGMCLIGRLDQ
jgi:hypothetical protein